MKRVCKICKVEKDIKDFSKHTAVKSGYLFNCKECCYKKRKSIYHPRVELPQKCNKCGKVKPSNCFLDAPMLLRGIKPRCIDCINEQRRAAEYHKVSNANKKARMLIDPEYKKHINNLKLENAKKHREQKLVTEAKKRAFYKKLDFNITKEDIKIPEKCPVLLIPLIFGNKDGYENSPSLDRIDNSKGYIKGNIQIISKKANSMKNSGSPAELLLFAKWINKTFKK